MAEIELNDRELYLLTNCLQSQESLGVEETTLLRKLSELYHEEIKEKNSVSVEE